MQSQAQAKIPSALIDAHARSALVLVESPQAAERLALSVDGEPALPARTVVHREGITRGLNLLGSEGEDGRPPWRPVEGAAIVVQRVPAGQWGLPDGATMSLRAAPEVVGLVEYATAQNGAAIALSADEDYAFEGYFARHRCAASVRIELLAASGVAITTLSKSIPKATGGAALESYARVTFKFHAVANAVAARLSLSIDAYEPAVAGQDDAFLFFAHLSLRIDGEAGLRWQAASLTPDQLAALNQGAALIDIELPRVLSPAIAPSVTITDAATGEDIGEVQLPLPLESPATFAVSSFDGVTLCGRVSGAARGDRLELRIDGIVVAATSIASDQAEHEVKLRVPDTFLDGAAHVVELREAASGKALYLNALTLRFLTTPWETLLDLSRSAIPAELQPLAARRYANLTAHTQALAESATHYSPRRFLAAANAHTILAAMPGKEPQDAAVAVPPCEAPQVSILTCTGDIAAFRRTVAALVLSFNHVTWELVVVTDDDAANVADFGTVVSGVRVLAAPRGTSRATMLNLAAREARGEHLALIEPTIEPAAQWLDELLLGFALFPETGMAAAKITSAAGRLLAAGGALLPGRAPQAITGSGNPHHPAIAHARVVDYAPLHAVLVPRHLWQQVGGLSETFDNRPSEDADLALKLKALGRSTLYVPTAAATLHAAPTSGITPAQLSALRRAWPALAQPEKPSALAIDEAMDRTIFGRVLVIDQQTPRGDTDAGSYAALQEMRLFQALGYKVTFLPLNLQHLGIYTRALQRVGVEVVHAPFVTSAEDFLRTRGEAYDLVYVTRYQVARAALPAIRRWCTRAKVIFNTADLHFLRELRSGLAQSNPDLLRRSLVTRNDELEIIRQADLTLSYSDVERAVVQSHNLDRGRTAKAPWVVHPQRRVAPFELRRDVAFIGSFGHAPNVEAAKFFARQVMPALSQVLPRVRFVIYGSQMRPDVAALAGENIIVAGHVPDVAIAYTDARVFVAPLLSGAGIKGKVVEAMAHGIPSVLSSVAAEGIGALAGTHYLQADTVEAWMDAIATLYTDEARWSAMSSDAQSFVAREYSQERGVALLRQALEEIDVFPPREQPALCHAAPQPPLL